MRLLLLYISLLLPAMAVCQTGPAGVGTTDSTSTLKLWYRIDNGVTGSPVTGWDNNAGVTQLDLSSSGSNRPSIDANDINGFDALNFDGNDYLQITGSLTTSNFVTNQASSFIVSQRNSTTASWLYATSPHQTNRFSCHVTWSNSNVYFDIGNCCGTSSRIQVGSLTGLNSYSYWSYMASNGAGKQLYRDGTLLQNRSNTTTYSSHASHTFRIGETFNGNLTEVIIYRERINTTQRLLIENYLSAKYGLSSNAVDIYDEDDGANGDHDYDVAGIGRLSASDLHNDSRGTGIIRMLNPTDLDNDEFLMWGHDGASLSATDDSDIPGDLQGRFVREWRVSETDSSGSTAVDVGAVDIRWDLTGLGTVTASDLRLLIDSDGDGNYGDETGISGATSLGSNIYEFSGVTGLTNNTSFTLGTIDWSSTPLPIELLSFTAEKKDESIALNWSTATEKQLSHFEVLRLNKLGQWEQLGSIYRDEDSMDKRDYQLSDHNPLAENYYQLKSVDKDGSFELSDILSVSWQKQSLQQPTLIVDRNTIRIEGLPVSSNAFRVYNMLGSDVTNKVSVLSASEEMLTLDISNLTAGVYAVQLEQTTLKFNNVIR